VRPEGERARAGQLVRAVERTQNALIIVPMGLSTVAYAVTVWMARYAPVLIGGPLLTVFWIAVMYLTVLN
jgi:hypothetical protein